MRIPTIKSINNDINNADKPNLKPRMIEDNADLCIDISSHSKYPICILSNFAPTDIIFDGVRIKSIEGFLQSLKVQDPEKQKEICLLNGIKAKYAGKKLNEQREFDYKNLYWQGVKYDRNSSEYKALLERVYKARYEQDMNFYYVLYTTKNRNLTHKLGEKDPNHTLLTENEFVDILMNLRDSDKSF